MAFNEDIVFKDSKLLCNLCQVYITQYDDKDQMIDIHINDKNHKELYMQRVMVQNSVTMYKNEVHCRLCKMKISDLAMHVPSLKHNEILNLIKITVEKDGNFLELPQTIQKGKDVFCKLCDCSIKFALECISEHINDCRHKRVRALAVQPFNGIFSVEDNNDDLWCKICQVYFENYIETIFEHVDQNKEHNVKLTKILRLIEGQNITIDSFLTNPTEHMAICKKCNTGVACNVDNLERHIKGKKHSS